MTTLSFASRMAWPTQQPAPVPVKESAALVAATPSLDQAETELSCAPVPATVLMMPAGETARTRKFDASEMMR
jgi:hypothetical protein